MKILNTINQSVSSYLITLLSELGEVDSVTLSKPELLERAAEYDVFFIGLGLHIDREVIDHATNLRVICTATTGLDHIDLEYAKQKGIEVMSLRGEEEFLNSVTSTAELAFGLLLDLARNISVSFESIKKHEWNREKFCGHALRGKILGIVGCGRLGKMMVQYAKAFGMEVVVTDPFRTEEECLSLGVKKVEFENLVEMSDYISIHVHLSHETENMFRKEVFEKMKPSTCIVNTSRGKIVNEDDVIQALQEKKIAGYATDVLADELSFPRGLETNALIAFAQNNLNVVMSPHLGGMTYESREATDCFMVEKLKRYLKKA